MIHSSRERLHYPKVELILQYHVPINSRIQRAMLIFSFSFYQFRDECELEVGQPPSYSLKLHGPRVSEIVSSNKSLVEPESDLVNAAFLNYRPGITT